MLSRRNARIKVMQVLYGMADQIKPDTAGAEKKYRQTVDQSFEMLLFTLYLMTQVAGYAFEDAKKRRNKHLPTPLDKAFTPKLFDNEAIRSFVENPYIQKLAKDAQFDSKIADGLPEIVYKKFVKAYTDDYKDFIFLDNPSRQDYIDILLQLLKFCLRESEIFVETIWTHYPTFLDDYSLVLGAAKKIIKAMPLKEDFWKDYYPSEDAVIDFGVGLIKYIGENDRRLLETIVPELENWEPDRVAILDMILLKMGMAEFLSCPTVPAHVTINEYVELAKMYSTEKSHEFINGVLDKLWEILNTNSKIEKQIS